MKYIKFSSLVFACLLSFSVFSQNKKTESTEGPNELFKSISQNCMESNGIKFDIKRVFAPFSISKSNLTAAKTLADLRPVYNPSWVKEFVSLTITAYNNGIIKVAQSKGDILSQEQKIIMEQADVKSKISLVVKYIPEHNLKDKPWQEFNYTFVVEPEQEAQFNGGKLALERYLKNSIIDKLTVNNFDSNTFSAFRFEVNTSGKVISSQLVETTKNEATDLLILEALKNMPNWIPAAYKDGLKESQQFTFILGNMESCTINLLSILRD